MRHRKFKMYVSLIYWIFMAGQRLLLSLIGQKPAGKCVVIYYHEISEDEKDKFLRQMIELKRHAEVISADTYMKLEKGKNYVMLTFDDGFQSLTANALPELNRLNIPYTIFIPTRYIGKAPGWDFHSKEKIFTCIMTENQIRQYFSHSAAIGSHSDSHPVLTHLSDDKAFDEIGRSREILEQICDSEVSLFSFPYGAYNSKLAEHALKSGYKRVFTSKPHVIYSEFRTPVIGRFPVNPSDSLLEFKLTIAGAYVWMDKVFTIKRKVKELLGLPGNYG